MRARIAPLCLVLLVMGLASAGADVFSQVPADAVLVVTAPSPDALTDGFGGFSDGFLPGSSQKIDSTIGLMLTSQTGVKDGLDMAGPVAMAVMLAPPAEEAVVAEAPTEEEGVSVEASAQVAKPSFATIMIVSLSDEAAWREAMGENITSDEGDQYEHILGDFGPAAYFTVKDGFLVTAESADHLALWAEAISTPMGEARGKKLAGGLARSTVSAHLSITTLKRLYPQWSALLDGVSPQTGNEMTDAVFDAYLDMAREIADGVDGVLLEAVASKKGLRLGATLEVAEGSLFQEFFSSQKPLDTSMFALVPKGGFAFGAGGLALEPVADLLTDFSEGMFRAMMGEGGDKGEADEAMARMEKMIEDYISSGFYDNNAFSVHFGPDEAGLGAVVASRPPDVAKLVEVWSTYAGDTTFNPMASQGFAFGEVQRSEETIAGTQVTVVRIPLDMSQMDPSMTMPIKAMYGDAMEVMIAGKGETAFFTLNAQKAQMEALLTGEFEGVNMTTVENSLSALSGKPSAAVLLSAPDMVRIGMSVATTMMMPGSPLPALPTIEVSQYVTMAASFDKTSVLLELYVPTEQIQAGQMAMMQMSMMMQMQQAPPAGQESSGLTPDEEATEAPAAEW